MALMNTLHEYREVRLPLAEGSNELLETLWVHRSIVNAMRFPDISNMKARLSTGLTEDM